RTRSRKLSFREEFKGQRHCRCTSRGMAYRSDLLLRQPRLSTNESESTRANPAPPEACAKSRPTPGPAGEEHLALGGAALKHSPAAYRRVCFSLNAKQAGRRWLVAAMLLAMSALSLYAQAPAQNHPLPQSPSNKRHYLMSESLDLVTLESKTEENFGQAAVQQGQSFVIQRIEFIGNRRVRTDTLKARIFSREGDIYNEETLRRDFQALWNTQFFEDVKLSVEDSPDRANAKIIVFEVKERPVIRRIRYEGIHSVSESDILDRFK